MYKIFSIYSQNIVQILVQNQMLNEGKKSIFYFFIYLKYNTMVLDSHPSTLTCKAKKHTESKKHYKPNKLVC